MSNQLKTKGSFGLDEQGQVVSAILTLVGVIGAVLSLLVYSEVRAAINTANIDAGSLSIVDVTPLIIAMFSVFIALIGLIGLVGGFGRRA